MRIGWFTGVPPFKFDIRICIYKFNIKLGDVSLFYSCCEVHWALDAFKNIMMKIGPNASALDGLCIWMMQISSMYIGHEEDFNFILISFCLIISSLNVL
jgi:hypothetical protein